MNLEKKLPLWNELPTFDIYLDQLLDITNDYVSPVTGELLTKTMMHNYTKAQVIVRPKNKRYSRIHLAGAIIVSLLKSVFSLDAIKKGFQIELNHGPPEDVYNRFIEMFNQVSSQNDLSEALNKLPEIDSKAAIIQYEAIIAVVFRLKALSTMEKIVKK
ncbi:DUF1836 domain-containing protein [Oenococcus oeni]|uniref:DUF1836 domain-containing protein n=1 Tax=Oenococcus oeni TaxID=1247 RepID=UPI0005100729|nr:DUF1836 domain-containing protein [Oenococcus oeni]KGH54488.1 hypothetical protein X463_09250 [Oenococcus oeni S22]OIK62601.1 hypothetical protein ATW62_04640 [Oenococcus oeni]OIK80726.1 hypothetical protein ATW73_04720 [Oenococcus oeni]OIL90028.1 hypothetical protein ATX42_04645 [Oenococcus oeni]OIM66333.1 hypothetical protein ATX88_04580 [Oenococcus oeni]